MPATTKAKSTSNFYPRPPRGGRHSQMASHARLMSISIHALREEGDDPTTWNTTFFVKFLSTPSARRATFACTFTTKDFDISIHALREEGDSIPAHQYNHSISFLSTPSARRATIREPSRTSRVTYFYPRPPRGGRLVAMNSIKLELARFLSTPSARRATPRQTTVRNCYYGISIHALREEGDSIGDYFGLPTGVFLSTPSARRATSSVMILSFLIRYFYPRPPRGGRLQSILDSWREPIISIHALREEGDVLLS